MNHSVDGGSSGVGVHLRREDRAIGKDCGWVESLEKINVMLNNTLIWIAGLSLTLIILLVVVNTVSRGIFDLPMQGVSEMVGWLCAVSTAFSLGYTQIQKGHVYIDILVNKFPRSMRKVVLALMDLLGTAFFAMVTWQLISYGLHTMKSGQLSQTLQVAYYPLIFVVAVGFVGLTTSLLTDLCKILAGRDET